MGGHNFIDFKGQKIDFLTIVARDGNNVASNGSVMWKCKCDCGKDCIVSSAYLRKKSKSKKSCGCQNINNPIDLIGQRFGRLVVIEENENHIQPNGAIVRMWKCKCDCGNEIIVSTGGLNRKNRGVKSCGCIGKEKGAIRFKEISKKYNTYDLSGQYGIGYTDKNEPFYFDLEDYEKIKDYYWSINHYGYVYNHNEKNFFHRLIMDINDGLYIDHINHKKIDNRKQNLRIVTLGQNGMNKKLLDSNTSGYTGVYYRKDRKKWEAYLSFNKKRMSFGQFDNKEDAIKARKEAEEKYFGEYSYSNSMQKEQVNEKKNS